MFSNEMIFFCLFLLLSIKFITAIMNKEKISSWTNRLHESNFPTISLQFLPEKYRQT